MHRRKFLSTLATAGACAGLPPSVSADPALESWKSQFTAALEHKPWLLAFRSVTADSFSAAAEVTGRMPTGLQGTFYRNGPAKYEIGGYRYRHWFDGDGMLQPALRIVP